MFDEQKHPRDEDGKFTEKGELRQNTGYDEIIAADIEAGTYHASDEEEGRVQTPDEIDALYGEEFTGYKGQEAINKLLEEKHGHIKAAFHREDMGDIDLVWGSDTVGLQHIIKQRETERSDEQGKKAHVEEIFSNMVETIESGKCNGKNKRGCFEIFIDKGQRRYFSVVSPEYHNHKVTFVVTAFRRDKKNKKEH